MMFRRKKQKLQQLLLKIEEITFTSLTNKYAKKQTKTALGNGVAISSKDDKLQKDANKWAKKNKLHKLAASILYWSKIWGRVIVSPVILENGDMIFSIAYPMQENRVSQIVEQGQQAVIYKRPTQDDTTWLIKEVWDTEKVQRFWVNKNKELQTEGQTQKIKAPYKLKTFEYHNLGYLPVFEYHNFEIDTFEYGPRTQATDAQLAFNADVNYIEDLYNLILQVAFVESLATQTYLSFNLDPGTLNQLRANAGGLKSLLLTRIAATSKKVDVERGSKPMEMIQGQFQAGQYMEMAVSLEKIFAEGVGSSFQAEGQAQATATEIVYTNSDDEKTANEDSLKLADFFNNVLCVIHEIDPIEDDQKFTVKVIGNKVLSDMDQLDLEIKKNNAGITTKEQLIQAVLKLDEEDAALQKEKTDKESEEEQERFMQMSGAPGNDLGEPNLNNNQQGMNPNKDKGDDE